MKHELKTYNNKLLIQIKVTDNGSEFYTTNEVKILSDKIKTANKEHGLQFESDFSSLNSIKKEIISEKFTEISERWGLNYENN